jgi:hypothetical protein
VKAEFSAEFLQQERARYYAYGRIDSRDEGFVRSADFVAAVMAEGTPITQWPDLYRRMVAEKGASLARAAGFTAQAA